MNRKEEFEHAKAELEENFDAGWNEILSLANAGYEEAMEYVARSYYTGQIIEQSDLLAYQWFQKIVALYPSNGSAWMKIADCNLLGYGVPRNHEEAIKYYRKAWENGIADGGYEIGWIYSFGYIANSDEVIAAKWFQRAADKGSAKAMYFMGFFFSKGYGGLSVSEKMAAKYWREAAAMGDASSIWQLLNKKCYGDNAELLELRKKLFDMAESGNSEAQTILGLSYLNGDSWEISFGLEKNPEEAQRWFEKAAAQRNTSSIYELGKAFLDEESGFKIDIDKGEQYLLQADKLGNFDACYELYRIYKWIKKDSQKALLWGERSIESGRTFLCYDIAMLYYKGEGTAVNYEKAAFYFRRCTKDDMEEADSNQSYLPLAKCCLLSNHPTSEDYKDAYEYLKLAFNAANEKSYCSKNKGEIEYWIAYMLDKGLYVERNLEQAFMHYSRSAEQGFSEAQEEIKHFKKSVFGWKKI